MSAAAVGVTAAAVGVDAVAIVLALVWAHSGHARTHVVVENSAAAIHVVLVAAVAAIGTSVQWRPDGIWLGAVTILSTLVAFYGPIFRSATRRTTGHRVISDLALATGAVSILIAFVSLLLNEVATGSAPVSAAAEGLALGLLVLGFITLPVGAMMLNIPDGRPEPPAPPPAQPVDGGQPPVAVPAHSATAAESIPTRNAVFTNAGAHDAMARTPCSACRSLGYDVETYVHSSPHSWYAGRCPRCGDRRDFYFRTDD